MNEIQTKRLVLRRFTADDWPDLYEYLSDDAVVKFEPYEVFSMVQSKEEAVIRAGMECYYAVCLKESGKLIGNVYLGKADFDTLELGYVFHAKYQGFGFATEAVSNLLSIAFEEWNTRRIIAMCNPLNQKSWALLERIGMRREGTLIQNIYFKRDNLGNPIWCDTYQYAILRDEWNNNYKSK